MARLIGWVNVLAGFCLLSLILSGVFSRLLSSIADWNSFNTIAAKIVVSIAGILAIFSSVYLVIGQTREHGKS
jgi:Zn-dependent protease with chaperone function